LSGETLQRVCETGVTVPAISIVSPIRGVVSMADARAGQIVQATEHLYHIVDTSRVWIVAKVLEADAGKVKPGLPVECTFAMSPDEVYRAAIDHIELRLNSDRTLSAKAILDNSSRALKGGMFGRVTIQLAAQKAVVCPTEALIHDGPSTFALVEQSAGNFTRNAVVVGDVRGPFAAIDDGLFPGDKVVTVGSHELGALFAKQAARQPLADATNSAGVTAQGQIELPTDQKTYASAPIEGRIRRIYVQHGQQVARGQMLAELDSLAFKSLQLDLLQARSSLEQVSQNLARVETLGDALARKTLWELQSQRDTLQQTVTNLRRQLTLAGLTDREVAAIESADLTASPSELASALPIRAPADGLICDFELVPGQVVARQDPLFELHNPTKVWVRSYLFEQDAFHVRAGQAVQVGLVSDPTFQAQGRIERLDPILVSGNRALSVWTELDNPGGQLKEGMAATVTIDTPTIAGR
jgi:RND family efflux transporter MFP subunit